MVDLMLRERLAMSSARESPAAISQSHLQRQFNELILVRVAAFGEGLEDLREKKGL